VCFLKLVADTMNLRSFLLGGAVALGANAFLVVPKIDGDIIAPQGDFTGLHPLEAFTAQQQQVELICKECPFREVNENGDVSWTDGFLTSLVSPAFHSTAAYSFPDISLIVVGTELLYRRWRFAGQWSSDFPAPAPFCYHCRSAPGI
jgi:hypothetical protein